MSFSLQFVASAVPPGPIAFFSLRHGDTIATIDSAGLLAILSPCLWVHRIARGGGAAGPLVGLGRQLADVFPALQVTECGVHGLVLVLEAAVQVAAQVAAGEEAGLVDLLLVPAEPVEDGGGVLVAAVGG